MYIHNLTTWPDFYWDKETIFEKLSQVRYQQGRLLGHMGALGFDLQQEAILSALTEEVLKTSEIEGEKLDKEQIRSSIARRLGIDIGALTPADRNVEGIVEIMVDATTHFAKPITEERLFNWHAALFPTGRSGMVRINVAAWRDDIMGPMQVVSGPIGKEKIHYEAPEAQRLSQEMTKFLTWFNTENNLDAILKAAIAHLWFITLHPFDDGNGRIARAISDLTLARSENSTQRFYSMSSQIQKKRNAYYEILERTQKGDLDITRWLTWFLDCLGDAINGAETVLAKVLFKARFWETANLLSLNARQKLVLNRLLDGFEGKLTSSKWAKLAKCSQDTASRDIDDLIQKTFLKQDSAGGRSTNYVISILDFK